MYLLCILVEEVFLLLWPPLQEKVIESCLTFFLYCCNRDINPDVVFEVHNYNITSVDHFSHFVERLR